MKRTTSKTRYTDFHMIINYYDREGVDFFSLDQDQKKTAMRRHKFISQDDLEQTLEEAQIKTRSNFTVFQDYGGQLQRQLENGKPYWNLYLKTKIQVIGQDIVRHFSKFIFNFDEKKVNDRNEVPIPEGIVKSEAKCRVNGVNSEAKRRS